MRGQLVSRRIGWLLLGAGLLLTFLIYVQGIGGGFIFDDYPNIVDNKDVQPKDATLVSLVRAMLSSPASEFKRPLASLTFAINFLFTGSDPAAMKVTNIVIHLLNGIACFFLTRLLSAAVAPISGTARWRPGVIAGLVATAWMLLPINLTSVLYVVQRMESLANLAVFIGLIGYVKGRQSMRMERWGGLVLAIASITLMPLLGLLAKETAVLVPLYALCIELVIFRGKTLDHVGIPHLDRRIGHLFLVLLAAPFVLGSAWLSIKLSSPRAWASRDFTLYTRLLSECRIVVDYLVWTIFPRTTDLSFYHDDFLISRNWIRPVSTLICGFSLLAIVVTCFFLRRRLPLVSLGLALFLACQSLTATVIPLELIYEHRNYFASFGLMLVLVPLLASLTPDGGRKESDGRAEFFVVPRRVLLGAFMVYWAGQTWMTAVAWGTPLSLANELASRNPRSPRAQYELGRTYIILSKYDPSSPFTKLAYPPLERAMLLPGSSILPEQALIFMNSRMHLPLRDEWWDSIVRKLEVRRPGIQDESALGSLGTCAINELCNLPPQRMVEAFGVALSHPNPTARLQAMYADYAWSELGDGALATRLIRGASKTAPGEPAYRITLVRFLTVQGQLDDAAEQIRQLEAMNLGGTLTTDIARLKINLDEARRRK